MNELSEILCQWNELWRGRGWSLHLQNENPKAWNEFGNSCGYCPTVYSSESIAYQLEYQRGHGGEWLDASCILLKENSRVAALPLTLSRKNNAFVISSQGMPLLPPLFQPNCPPKVRKNCVKDCLDILQEIGGLAGACELQSEEVLVESSNFSEWHMESVQRGAKVRVSHELYLDLRPAMEQIRTSFRRRFRSMINQGMKLWRSELWSGPDCRSSQWEEFRMLHLHVAGRATRSLESWQVQHECVQQGTAFVVALRESQGRLIGAALYECTSTEGSYSVGAYDRDLFDKPVSHVAHALAVEEMKRRGLSWYRIGARPFARDFPEPTEKEMSIGDFKQGFASHVFPKIRLTHTLDSTVNPEKPAP